jgi:hypothetical protein
MRSLLSREIPKKRGQDFFAHACSRQAVWGSPNPLRPLATAADRGRPRLAAGIRAEPRRQIAAASAVWASLSFPVFRPLAGLVPCLSLHL